MTGKRVLELPSHTDYRGRDLAAEARIVVEQRLRELVSRGRISLPESWGLMVGRKFTRFEFRDVFDHPRSWVAFGVGDGRDAELQLQDAVRMARATARIGLSTLCLISYHTDQFQQVVRSMSGNPDDPYPWGDRAESGAVLLSPDCDPCLVACAGCDPITNDYLATEVANYLRSLRLKLDRSSR